MHARSHLATAAALLRDYDGSAPFAHFLKEYFRREKKHGSRDRRVIASLCYAGFRVGSAMGDASSEDRICTGVSLTGPEELRQAICEPGKVLSLDTTRIFPWHAQVSPEIDAEKFSASHLVQPDLFLRVRPAADEADIMRKLSAGGIEASQEDGACIRLPNASKLPDNILLNRDAVVQDLSSQRLAELLKLVSSAKNSWDCCAASGGKSLLALDTLDIERLLLSDIRESILANLRKRFSEAGLSGYRSSLIDASKAQDVPGSPFDLVICDAPCTGSGTWGRTPEKLSFFDLASIEHYSKLQRRIAQNAIRFVKPGGYLLYSTCSVFAAENERVVSKTEGAETMMTQYFTGWDRKADTLFGALLRKC